MNSVQTCKNSRTADGKDIHMFNQKASLRENFCEKMMEHDRTIGKTHDDPTSLKKRDTKDVQSIFDQLSIDKQLILEKQMPTSLSRVLIRRMAPA